MACSGESPQGLELAAHYRLRAPYWIWLIWNPTLFHSCLPLDLTDSPCHLCGKASAPHAPSIIWGSTQSCTAG